MRKFQAALLDVDGTLVDSNDLHARAWQEAFRDFGHDVPLERIRPLIGMGGDKLIPAATGLRLDDPEVERIADHRLGIFRRSYQDKVKPFPHVRDLLMKLRDDGYKLVVATSARPEEYQPLLEEAHVRDLLEAETSADDADSSKPDPDIVHAALRRAGVAPDHAVMLGDTPYDIEAASKAGVATIALRSGGRSDKDLKQALAVYDSPVDLLARYRTSPLASSHP